MQALVTLRFATVLDAELLLAWRNDPQTRLASHCTHELSLAEHLAWLNNSLANTSRRLFIAEKEGVPVGSARTDARADGVNELSWTVAPAARNQGIGKQMLRVLLVEISGPVCAEVRVGNTASARIAEAAGLVLLEEEQGVLRYGRV